MFILSQSWHHSCKHPTRISTMFHIFIYCHLLGCVCAQWRFGVTRSRSISRVAFEIYVKIRKKRNKNRSNRYFIQMRPLNRCAGSNSCGWPIGFCGIGMMMMSQTMKWQWQKSKKYFYRCQFSAIHGDDVVRGNMFEIMYQEFGYFAFFPDFFFFFHSFRHLDSHMRQSSAVPLKVPNVGVQRASTRYECMNFYLSNPSYCGSAESNRHVVKGSIIFFCFEISSGFRLAAASAPAAHGHQFSFWTFNSFIVPRILSSG